MKYLPLALLSFLLRLPGFAQDTPLTGIRGTITDRQSQFPLVGATITVVGSDPLLGAAADESGRFRINNVPVGRQAVEIHYTGYEPLTLSNLLLVAGKDLELNIELVERVSELSAIEIVAGDDKAEAINKMSTVSTRSFSLEEARRYAGTLQDPARMAQNFAGVSSASDDRNDIIIRGNSPTGVLWRLEGIDIPNPSHFSTLGTTGGPVSILNANNLANSDFTTSAFAAEYGNALAGVFDLRLRSGNPSKREWMGQVGFNGFEVGAEGPFRKAGSATYIVNYRYSVLGLVQAMGVDFGTGAAVPEYQDITFKVDLPSRKMGRFSIFGIGGTSFIEFRADEAGENNLYSGDRQNSEFTSRTGVAGLSHTYFITEKTLSKLTIAASHSSNHGYIDSLGLDDSAIRIFGANRAQDKLSGHYLLNHKFNARVSTRMGIIAERYFFNLIDSALYQNSFYFLESDYRGSADLGQAYAQASWRVNENWTLNGGIHTQYFFLNQRRTTEPRLGVRYSINDRQSVSFGAGMHSQLQPVTVYFSREEAGQGSFIQNNRSLGFNRAVHVVAGYDLKIGAFARLKSEVYFQELFDIAIDRKTSSFSMLNVGADFQIPNNGNLVNDGRGTNYGVEITLERFLNKGFYYLFTSSLFDSRYQGSDRVWRNTAFNGNFVFNLLGGYEWKSGQHNAITADVRITYAGGRRYTPIDLEASRESGLEIRIDDQAFSSQFTAYFRADAKIGYRINGKSLSQAIYLDVRNVSNNQNVFNLGYNRLSRQVETTYQTGLFPMLLYSVYF